AAARDAGIYLTPPPTKERLLSNLLPVAFLPERISVASTHCRTRRQVREVAEGAGLTLGEEWILRGRMLISFRDLHRREWSDVCDQGTVEHLSTNEWSQADDSDRGREFVELLNHTLEEFLREDVEYRRRLEFFYFRATPDLKARE